MHKWGVWYYIAMIGLGAVVALGMEVVYMLANGKVQYEGGPMPQTEANILAIVMAIILITYAISALSMLMHLIAFKGAAMEVTEEGIENTLTAIVILAFVVVLPVKKIPWNAMTRTKNADKDMGIHVKVDKELVEAAPAAKMILRIRGFNFCKSFCRPAFVEEELPKKLK